MRWLLVVLLLVGCSRDLTLIGREDGARGSGTATTGSGSGPLKIELRGKAYEGRWYFAASGGAGTIIPFAGKGSIGTVGSASASPGVIHATAPDGSRLRCEFTYSEWNSSGFGVCTDTDGRVYDLVIE